MSYRLFLQAGAFAMPRCLSWSFAFIVCCVGSPVAGAAQTEDFLNLPLEQLIEMEISTVSRFPQKKLDAPAAVTVITSSDIKDYGYRTLADVLRSVRGVYITYDRSYDFFGARGFSRSGDFNSRLLLMIDGHRVNDVLYDTAYIGTDGLVDMENIARIEFVPGSGSALYGNNAFFGVMNVITKNGKDTQGGEVKGGFGSYGQDREKATLGYRFENGADALLSASRQRIDGQKSLSFNQMATPGVAPFTSYNLDSDSTDRVLGKFSYNGFELEGVYSNRNKSLPTASYGVDLNMPEYYNDINKFIEARYEKAVNDRLTASAKLFWGAYNFNGGYYYGGIQNRDEHHSQWWGTEFKALLNLDAHKLALGGEYQDNFLQHMTNYDPTFVWFDINNHSNREGLYVQDEFTLNPQLLFNAGARYDHYSNFGGTTNPRVGVNYKPWSDTAFKLIYGTAYRAPNLGVRTPGLKPERIKSWEAIAEYQTSRNLRLTATSFYNDVTDLISKTVPDPNIQGAFLTANSQRVTMQGVELESEYRWNNSTRLRGSYAYAYAKDMIEGSWLVNSPKNLVKLNLSSPLWHDQLHAGTELQYVGERKGKVGMAPGYTLVNLTLTAAKIVPGLEISGSLYNLLNKNYTSVAGVEMDINQVPQDGRNFRVNLSYRF